jgi:hypothetical protein
MVDLSDIEVLPPRDFEPLPEGWYGAEIIDSDKPIASEGHPYLSVTFSINDDGGSGEHIGRRIWGVFSLWNPDEKKRKAGQRNYSDMCQAMKLTTKAANSEALHGIPLDIKLVIKEGNKEKGFRAKNQIYGYRISAGVAIPPTQAVSGASNGRPWET